MTPDRYKKIRIDLGYTQAEWGKHLGVSREAINQRETGKVRICKEAALAAVHLSKQKQRKVAA